jgi:hypothetical protein
VRTCTGRPNRAAAAMACRSEGVRQQPRVKATGAALSVRRCPSGEREIT